MQEMTVHEKYLSERVAAMERRIDDLEAAIISFARSVSVTTVMKPMEVNLEEFIQILKDRI